jgi:hypothetical protein
MWQIKNSTITPTTLDFSHSGQQNRQVLQLFAGDILLINAIELVDWQEEAQFLICRACGIPGCKSGDWVSLRLAGDMILLMPAFAAWFEDGKTDDEYHPPYYLIERGIAYFTLADYQALSSLNTSFPAVEKLRRMNMQEAILAFQLDAPSQVFGNPPEKPVARRDVVVGASEGNEDEHLKFIEAFAQRQKDNQSPVKLRLPKAEETVISLFLDTHEFLEWKVLAGVGSETSLMLNSEFVISIEQ